MGLNNAMSFHDTRNDLINIEDYCGDICLAWSD